MVVLALVGIIAAMGVIMGFDTLGRSSVHEERDLLVTLLTGQRAKALANVNESAHGLRIEDDSYVLVEVESGDEREVERNENVVVDPEVEIVFEQLSGTVSDEVELTLSQEGKTQSVEVNEAGRIEW